MESIRNSEDMLAKASQLWTMLDDMAENSPESYRQFMRQQMKEAKEYYAPPEPYLCLRTHILAPTEKILFVNICGWNRVPAPCSPSEPVSLSAGKIQEVSHPSELYSIIDIAFNPSVLERRNEDVTDKDQLIHLVLRYIEEHYDITLSPSYSRENFKLKGSLERMRQSLRKEQPPLALSKNTKQEVTLCHLGNMVAKEDSGDLPVRRKDAQPAGRCLIEEVSCTESPEELCTPAYEIATRKDANGKPLKIELKVKLPELRRISECSLSISKDDLLLECPGKCRLQLDLPEVVNEEAATATFHKRKGVLLITMPVV
nr:PIH1 domain-containing protein 2 [Pogona vitticeps]XP_020648788.1 PIH1 domain-containing protein 2 [Pogona vitticeps]